VDFQALVHEHGDKFRLTVHGNGLIASIMRIAVVLGTEVIPEMEFP
jgi:hypothetical protein